MTKPFTPFLTPDKPAPAGAPDANASSSPQALQTGSESTVTLKRDGDRVTHIIVRCTCGRAVELACEY